LQARFFAVISGGGPVAPTLMALSSRDPGAVPLSSWIAGGAEPHAVARLGAYSAMYFARLHETLQLQFPCLHRVMGAPAFERLAAQYLLAHPSHHASLRHLGRELARFVADSGWCRSMRPDLVDLALLEWARVEVFDEVDAPPIGPADLAALGADEWTALRLRSVPALRPVDLSFSVDELWYAADRGEPLPPPMPEPRTMLVFRCDHVVRHRRSAAREAAVLAQMRGGCSLETLCAAFATPTTELAEAAQAVFAALSQWAADGLIAAEFNG
jgi:hypothetical protein